MTHREMIEGFVRLYVPPEDAAAARKALAAMIVTVEMGGELKGRKAERSELIALFSERLDHWSVKSEGDR